MRRKTSFLLLTRHTDDEITDFLQRNAENGWRFVSSRGNSFRFIRKDYDGRRLASFSFVATDPGIPTENQLRQELPRLRKQGWDVISLTGPEDIADTKRHAFLYEEHPSDSVPSSDEDDHRVRRKALRKMISNLLVSVFYALFLAYLFFEEGMRITSSAGYLFASSAFALLFALSLFLSIRALLSTGERKRRYQEYIRRQRYRDIDRSTLLITVTLLALIILLLADSLYGKPDRGEQVMIGGYETAIYSQDIPVTLADLGIEAIGEYRTTIHQEQKSFIASYGNSYEQYLGEGADPASYLGYAVYESDSRLLLSMAEDQFRRQSTGKGWEAIIPGQSYVLRIRSGFALDENQIETIKAAVSPERE